jgi:hypothetical protein
VEVEDGINPLQVKKGGVFSSFSSFFPKLFSSVSSSEVGYPGAGNQHNALLEYISDVSDVSSYSSDAWTYDQFH